MTHIRIRLMLVLIFLLNSLLYVAPYQSTYAQATESADATKTTSLPTLALAPQTATFPFSDDFEAGVIGADWSSNSSGVGRVEISADSPYRGAASVFIGQKVVGNSGAYLELTIDLSNQPDVFLDFWWRATGEAYDSVNGVYISDNDGAIWKKIGGLSGNAQVYSHAVINVAHAAAATGLTLNNHFKVRLYYEDYVDRIGGLRIDDLRLTTRSQVVANFPHQENFEAATVQQGLYPQSWGVGLTEISNEDPHSGVQQIFLGQKRSGNGGAYLDLLIDLANQTDTYLDFWWRATGQAYESSNGIYLSDDNGTNWKKIGGLSGNSQIYSHAVFNLSASAVAHGLTFNNRFMVRLYYEDYVDRIGGLRIDDLRVTNRTQIVAAFPLQENFETQTVQQGLYPQSWGTGGAEISNENPYHGAYHLFLGQRVGGNSGAYLDLPIDLSNQTTAFLNFWWRATGEAYESVNGVYISDDEGINWKKVSNMNGNPQVYSHTIIDLASAASAHGLTLNNRFMIRLYYEDYVDRIGGLRIDNLRISVEDPRRIDRSFVYLPLTRR